MSASVESPLAPAFRRLAFSNLAAQCAEQLALAAAPLLAVLALGASAAQTAYLQTAQTLPFLVLSLPAGVLADRICRRNLMASAELLRCASLFGVVALLYLHALDLPALAILGMLGAVGTVVYSVTAPAVVPSLVAAGQLSAANRWLELARSTAFVAGPAAGGILVGAAGAPVTYVLAAVLSLAAVLLLAGLPFTAPGGAPRRRVLQSLAEGAAFVAGHALLRPILITAVVFNTAWFLLQGVYVSYAVTHLGMDATQTGMTLAVYGVGMVVGALSAPRLARRFSFGSMIVLGPLIALAAALLLLATLAYPSGWLAGLGFFLFGAGPILWVITTMTLRQAATPNAMLGRVSAIMLTATFGARPLGAALGAVLAENVGVSACLWACSAGFVIQFMFIAMSPVARLRQAPAMSLAN
jgi:predicted MFS family arabinose efflux permease